MHKYHLSPHIAQLYLGLIIHTTESIVLIDRTNYTGDLDDAVKSSYFVMLLLKATSDKTTATSKLSYSRRHSIIVAFNLY